MTDKPKFGGGFEAARRIADEILEDYLGPSNRNDGLSERIAEALVGAFDDGVVAENRARKGRERNDPNLRQLILTRLLREHGIGIATLDEMRDRTLAVARGELQLPPNEPKLWFNSIESVIESLRAIGGDHDEGDVELYEECVRTGRPMRQKE